MAYRKGETGGAHNLAKATRQATLKFFTKRRRAPRGWTGPRPKLETHLLRKFSNGVEACQCGLSMAGLSLTGLSMAGLSLIGLSMAGLSLTGLSMAGFSLTGLSMAGLPLAGFSMAGLSLTDLCMTDYDCL